MLRSDGSVQGEIGQPWYRHSAPRRAAGHRVVGDEYGRPGHAPGASCIHSPAQPTVANICSILLDLIERSLLSLVLISAGALHEEERDGGGKDH